MTRTPRDAFQSTEHRTHHEKTVKSESFQVACEYALLEFVHSITLSKPVDPTTAWDKHSQVVGAKRVLEILKSLSEVSEEKTPQKPQSLNYKV